MNFFNGRYQHEDHSRPDVAVPRRGQSERRSSSDGRRQLALPVVSAGPDIFLRIVLQPQSLRQQRPSGRSHQLSSVVKSRNLNKFNSQLDSFRLHTGPF